MPYALSRLLLATCALCVLGITAAVAGERGEDTGNAVRIYRDPATGKVIPPPKGVPWPAHPSHSTSQHGLKEVPSPVPGGGIEVDLQGRFQNPLRATTGPDGKVRIEHSNPTSDGTR